MRPAVALRAMARQAGSRRLLGSSIAGYVQQPVKAVKHNSREQYREKGSKIKSILSAQTEKLAIV
jgi:hypothetical protein